MYQGYINLQNIWVFTVMYDCNTFLNCKMKKRKKQPIC